MLSLSVVVITYNEEKNIGRCLESVKEIADEIIVVDSFSRDRTKDICSAFNAKFFEHPFEGHIQQKTFALSKSSSPYVLSVDADEALSEDLALSIREVKTRWRYDGYFTNRKTNYCGQWILHGGWYPDRKMRLFDTRKGSWTGINPHDRYELTDRSAPVGFLKGDLLHYSYYTVSDHVKQVDYFTEISARELFTNGRKASILRMLIAPFVRFVRGYVFRGGFLDGYYGLVICVLSSHAVFLKYAKLRQLYDRK